MINFLERFNEAQGDMTQYEFARHLDVSTGTVRSVQQGLIPRESIIAKIAQKLDWKHGDYADYYYGISQEESDKIVDAVESKIIEWDITQGQMVTAIKTSGNSYRKWKRNMQPKNKRSLVSFLEMDRETFEQTYERNKALHKRRREEKFVQESRAKPAEISPEELLDLRKKHGYSQYKLAEKVSVTQSTISLWEKGRKIPEESLVILHRVFNKMPKTGKPRKTEAQRKAESAERKQLLNYLDIKYDGQLSQAPEDCPLLNEYRELVGA